ncbi:MAG: hypothetical protein Q8Q56_05560, partial [Alphaproteobacteria bacterium]|nr:hypothetical protein [Alphaproteobacteria bacterium]
GAELPDKIQNTPQKMSIVELVTKTGELERMGRPKAAARLYAESVNHADVIWFDILFATRMIERLGYPEIAIEVYESSTTHPNTLYFASNALDAIQRLEHVPSRRVKSTLDHLCHDVRTYMMGFPDGDRSELGWIDLNDLAVFALVSAEWHKVAQPMIKAANLWRHTDVVPRVLSATTSDYDKAMLLLFGHNPKAEKFDVLVSVLLDRRLYYVVEDIKSRLNEDASLLNTRSVSPFNDSSKSLEEEKTILMWILADPDDHFTNLKAANSLEQLCLLDGASKMFQKIASNPSARTSMIYAGAVSLRVLAQNEAAIKAYQKKANRAGSEPFNVRVAKMAIKAYQKILNHPGASSLDIGVSEMAFAKLEALIAQQSATAK